MKIEKTKDGKQEFIIDCNIRFKLRIFRNKDGEAEVELINPKELVPKLNPEEFFFCHTMATKDLLEAFNETKASMQLHPDFKKRMKHFNVASQIVNNFAKMHVIRLVKKNKIKI